ncbi:MAG: hypothetical protein DIU68_017355 [Chloroflexota bacterium]|nr:MAG: hypothetical protein DIU68_17140 [Chloroflexota bacterium]
MRRWEYLTVFLEADARREEHFLREIKDWKSGIPPYAPEALIPQLNALGELGWELVTIQPVRVGKNYDVLIEDSASGTRQWTNRYLCAFKREKPD